MRMGIPHIVTSDQGREFNNAVNKELMGLFAVNHRLTTAYHPQVCIICYVVPGNFFFIICASTLYCDTDTVNC